MSNKNWYKVSIDYDKLNNKRNMGDFLRMEGYQEVPSFEGILVGGKAISIRSDPNNPRTIRYNVTAIKLKVDENGAKIEDSSKALIDINLVQDNLGCRLGNSQEANAS